MDMCMCGGYECECVMCGYICVYVYVCVIYVCVYVCMWKAEFLCVINAQK